MEERPTTRRRTKKIQDDVDVLIIEEEAPGLFCSKMMSSRHKHHETRSTCKHFYHTEEQTHIFNILNLISYVAYVPLHIAVYCCSSCLSLNQTLLLIFLNDTQNCLDNILWPGFDTIYVPFLNIRIHILSKKNGFSSAFSASAAAAVNHAQQQ